MCIDNFEDIPRDGPFFFVHSFVELPTRALCENIFFYSLYCRFAHGYILLRIFQEIGKAMFVSVKLQVILSTCCVLA